MGAETGSQESKRSVIAEIRKKRKLIHSYSGILCCHQKGVKAGFLEVGFKDCISWSSPIKRILVAVWQCLKVEISINVHEETVVNPRSILLRK